MANRVRQVATGSGTGSLSLQAPATGLQSFVNALGDGGSAFGTILDIGTGEWEVSKLTVTAGTPDTIARSNVVENSNGDTSAVDFTAGTKAVFISPVPQLLLQFDSALSPSDGDFIARVSGGWLNRSASQVRALLDLEAGTDFNAYDVMLADIAALTDPNADRIMFWDDSAGAIVWLTAGTGLAITTTTISLSFLGLESLTDPNADRIMFWDDSAGALAWLTAGTGLTITTTSIAVNAATTSAAGIAEASIASEVNTGTDTTRYVSPDSLAGSNFGIKEVQILVSDPNGSALTTGDGKAYFVIPPSMNGMNLVDADAMVSTVSSSGLPTIQIHNLTDTADMLSTRITIDANEPTSYTAAAAPVINTSNDDVATGDRLRIDVDVAGTGTKGLSVILSFQLP